MTAFSQRSIRLAMLDGINYDMSDIDSRCEGCPQVGLGKQYDQDIRSRGK